MTKGNFLDLTQGGGLDGISNWVCDWFTNNFIRFSMKLSQFLLFKKFSEFTVFSNDGD
jgi:hypothetical protein